MANSFLKEMIKALGDGASIAADGEGSAEFTGTIDTGSYILNAELSGSIYGGVPNNKVTAFAGPSTTGKTFFVLGIIKEFLNSNKDASVLYFDTEAAVTKSMMEDRGIDASRVIIDEPVTIQQFRHKTLKFIEAYQKIPANKRPLFMVVLDSLGQLSTEKELSDSTEGNDTRDMTRAQLIRATFRTIRLKLAKAAVPLLLTNHTYAGIGIYATTEMSGGGGTKFASDTIAFLSKKKEKVGTDVVGNIIHVSMYKSRLSKENKRVDVLITYDGGLDRYYGLLELAMKYSIVTKEGNKFKFPDGQKAFMKELRANPKTYWTTETLKLVDEAAAREFKYGGGGIDVELEDVENGEEDAE